MPKYLITAKRRHWYEVTVEADGEIDATNQVRDWMADEWEESDLEVRAEWDFTATEKTGTELAFICDPIDEDKSYWAVLVDGKELHTNKDYYACLDWFEENLANEED
jgi:hypothetical protein